MSKRSSRRILPTALSSGVSTPKARIAFRMSAFVRAGSVTQPTGKLTGVSCAGFGPPDCLLHGRAVEQDLQHGVPDAPLNEDLQSQVGTAHWTKRKAFGGVRTLLLLP